MRVNDSGPSPEPWITLDFTGVTSDILVIKIILVIVIVSFLIIILVII